jgi:protoporphyrinogen oxidase
MVNRFGKSVYDLIFCPYSQKFWGENPANISSEWANKRIGLNNLGYVIKKLLSNNPNKVIPKTYTTQFYYPDQGIGHICEKMSELIENNNGTIHLNSEIKQIKLEGNRISYIVFQQNGRRESIDGDFFVSTIPINKLVELISPSEENNLKTPLHDLASLRYRSLRLIFVKVNKNRITDCNWLYFPEAKYIFSRISEPKNWSSAMAPKGKTSLCIEIPCTKGDPIWKLHNNSLLNIVTSHLQELGFLRIDEVRDYFCLSLEYAYPVYSLGYKTELNYILGSISKINNLITIGRQGMFNYLSMDEVLGIGFSAAKLIENIFHNERDDKRNILLQFYREQRGSTPHS